MIFYYFQPTVAETIVLAKKTDKMDFTRRWLQDDLKSLAHLPPANIAPNAVSFDEKSICIDIRDDFWDLRKVDNFHFLEF